MPDKYRSLPKWAVSIQEGGAVTRTHDPTKGLSQPTSITKQTRWEALLPDQLHAAICFGTITYPAKSAPVLPVQERSYFQLSMMWTRQGSPCYLLFVSPEASELNSPEFPLLCSENLKNILFSAHENISSLAIGDEDLIFKNTEVLLFPVTGILEEIVQRGKGEVSTDIYSRNPYKFTVFKVSFHKLTANTHNNLVPSSRRFTNMDNTEVLVQTHIHSWKYAKKLA